jgi:hypothetical protein
MKGKVIFLTIMLVLGFACRNLSNKENVPSFPEADSVPVISLNKISPEAMAEISKNITNPIEIANLLQTLNIPFNQEYIAGTLDANRQSTNFDKAFLLGILGADLGYLNIYYKTGLSLRVLKSIKKLASDINVGQYFDVETIKKLSINRDNLDSLLFISVNSYNKIDASLRDNNQEQLTAPMIIGGWIEGQYLATQVVKSFPEKTLSDRIGEQKIILNDLVLLLRPYCNMGPQYASLCNDLENIKKIYRDIKITYTRKEPVIKEENGALVLTQTETRSVEMTKEQLEKITEITQTIRDKHILHDQYE